MMSGRRFTLALAGVLLIAAALCLTVRNLRDGQRAGQAARQALEQMAQAEPEPAPEPAEEDPRPEIPAYILDPEMEMPAVDIDGTAYIGVLSVPALELALPVASQWSYDALKLAPCRYTGSAYLDDLVIAGHNYRTHFAGLKNLAQGDEVLFTDADGNRFCYQVIRTEQLAGTAVEEMEAGDWDLTLFTCTAGGKARVTVRCERTASPAAEDGGP
nr:sortase [uncultured Dysosmobacter sp.]